MRLGAKRYVSLGSRRPKNKKISACLILLTVVALCFYLFMYYVNMIQPLMISLAESHAKILAEQITARAVSDLFVNTHDSDFISISHLDDGSVSSLQANLAGINRLRALATSKIQEALEKNHETTLQIPMGTLTGYELFSGLGPSLPIRLDTYGNTLVEFKSNFVESGINQTRLEVFLQAKTNVGIVLPTSKINREITTVLPVFQTVLLGDVPDNYVNIDRMGEAFEDDVLDIIG
ncbi:MAG: sporulation protein YunB [Ruminococcaceae bacterium]|nr:sporulation protein YunB [Oscillospiraceae bacterium]